MKKRTILRNGVTLIISLTVILIWVLTYGAFIYTLLGGYALGVKVPLYVVIFPLFAGYVPFPSKEVYWLLFTFIVITISGIFILRDFFGYVKKPDHRENFGRFSELFAVVISFTLLSYFISLIFTQQSNPFGNPVSSEPTNVILLSLMHAPVWEEIVYRTLLLGLPLYLISFRNKLPWYRAFVGGGFSVKNRSSIIMLLLSSFFFGSAHLYSWEPAKFPSVFIAGIILGYVFLRYGIYASITMHFLVDFSGSYSFLNGQLWIIASTILGLFMILWFVVGIPYYFIYLGEIFSGKKVDRSKEKEMENLVLGYRIQCPYCGFDQFRYLEDGSLQCLRCGSKFRLEKK